MHTPIATIGYAAVLFGAFTVMPAAAENESTETRQRMVTVKDRAPGREVFLQDLDEDDALVPMTGPWDHSYIETPIVVGPWAIDRLGSAQIVVLRDGSAREPAPPRARWGPADEEDIEPQATPWGGQSKTATPGKEPVLSNKPLDDNFPLRILGHESDALLVELPLLITSGPNQFDGRSYWVIVELFIDGKKVGDHRQFIDEHAIARMGPTHAWVKTLVPVPAPQGQLDVRVSRLWSDGEAAEGMFIRSVRFGR